MNYNDLYNFGRRQSYLRAPFLGANQAFHATGTFSFFVFFRSFVTSTLRKVVLDLLCMFFLVPRHAIEKDYYEILGVSKDASQDDIKKAFLTVSNLGHGFMYFTQILYEYLLTPTEIA